MKKKKIDDSGCYADRTSGVIQIVGDLEFDTASKFRRYLGALSRDHDSIVVEINSPGGHIEAGLMIIDTINLSEKKITVRATGIAMSMAAVILAAAPDREALENTTIMIHEGSCSYDGKFYEMDAEMAEIHRLEAVTWGLLDKRTKKRKGYWRSKCAGKNLYITAEQALKEHVIDRVCVKSGKVKK